MGKHAPARRDLDEGLRGCSEALRVAGKATPAGDPGEGALHDPAPRLDDKASLERLGCWLVLDRTGVRGRAQTPHGLNVPSELLLHPFTQLSPVTTIAPNQREPGKAPQQWLKQLLASRQVGVISPRHFGFHQKSRYTTSPCPF